MDLTTTCLACHLKKCHLIAFLTSPWAPMRRENEKKGEISPHTHTLSKSSSVLLKAKQSQEWKSNNMIYLGLLPESVRILAKKQETVSEMFERQGSVPALIHKVTWDGDEEFLNDWHDLLPLSIKGWRANLICLAILSSARKAAFIHGWECLTSV